MSAGGCRMSAEIGFVYLFANDSMPGLYKSSLKDGALSYCEVNLQCHLFALRNASSTGKAVAFDDSAVFGGAE